MRSMPPTGMVMFRSVSTNTTVKPTMKKSLSAQLPQFIGSCFHFEDILLYLTYILTFFSFVLLALVGLVIVASLYDSTLGEDQGKDLGRPLEYLLCFSIQRNVREVFSVNYNHQGLDVIHIIRFLMMCLVIIGHRMMQYSTNPIVNKRYLELVSSLTKKSSNILTKLCTQFFSI